MSHFAKVVDGIVTQVTVAEPEFFNSFIDDSPGQWIQTSYNTREGKHLLGGTPIRKNFACIGYVYDRERDAFYIPQPYPSWILDEDSCVWLSPIEMPEDGKKYKWNEEKQSWEEVDGTN